MLRLMIAVLIGGGIGTALGYFGKCTSGACPLTANWQRGAVSGALIGMLFCLASGCGGSSAVNASTANVTRISESQCRSRVAAGLCADGRAGIGIACVCECHNGRAGGNSSRHHGEVAAHARPQ